MSETKKVYLVFVSGRYRNFSNLKKVFDNGESATAYHDYLGKGLERYSPYKIEIREVDVEDNWNGR
jgi:hypothetical protein